MSQPDHPPGINRARVRRLSFIPILIVGVGATTAGLIAAVARSHAMRDAARARPTAVELPGRSMSEMRASVDAFAEARERSVVKIHFPAESGIKRIYHFTAAQLGLGIDREAMLRDAMKATDTGLVARLINGSSPVPVDSHPVADVARLRAALRPIAWSVRRRPRKAGIEIGSGPSFSYKPGRPGRAMDLDAAVDQVRQSWLGWNPDKQPGVAESTRFDTTQPPTLAIEAPVHSLEPSVTVEDLHQIDGVLGSFSTSYAATRTRGYNVALATSRIDGTVLAPGEVFSYNRTVGPRVASAGFREAPVILHGELVPGMGGGVCQVSSTLYNAVLLAGLRVVDRSHHAFPVHYLPAGRDATVVDGAIDFQFRNSTDAPICIRSSTHGGRVNFTIWGKSQPSRSISIETERGDTEPSDTETVMDSSVPPGHTQVKPGHPGLHVTVYRVVRENGQEVRREVVSRDHYHPFPTMIHVGPPRAPRPAPRRIRPATPPADGAQSQTVGEDTSTAQ
jgi:vancomycin resistance protein YoaR